MSGPGRSRALSTWRLFARKYVRKFVDRLPPDDRTDQILIRFSGTTYPVITGAEII